MAVRGFQPSSLLSCVVGRIVLPPCRAYEPVEVLSWAVKTDCLPICLVHCGPRLTQVLERLKHFSVDHNLVNRADELMVRVVRLAPHRADQALFDFAAEVDGSQPIVSVPELDREDALFVLEG